MPSTKLSISALKEHYNPANKRLEINNNHKPTQDNKPTSEYMALLRGDLTEIMNIRKQQQTVPTTPLLPLPALKEQNRNRLEQLKSRESTREVLLDRVDAMRSLMQTNFDKLHVVCDCSVVPTSPPSAGTSFPRSTTTTPAHGVKGLEQLRRKQLFPEEERFRAESRGEFRETDFMLMPTRSWSPPRSRSPLSNATRPATTTNDAVQETNLQTMFSFLSDATVLSPRNTIRITSFTGEGKHKSTESRAERIEAEERLKKIRFLEKELQETTRQNQIQQQKAEALARVADAKRERELAHEKRVMAQEIEKREKVMDAVSAAVSVIWTMLASAHLNPELCASVDVKPPRAPKVQTLGDSVLGGSVTNTPIEGDLKPPTSRRRSIQESPPTTPKSTSLRPRKLSNEQLENLSNLVAFRKNSASSVSPNTPTKNVAQLVSETPGIITPSPRSEMIDTVVLSPAAPEPSPSPRSKAKAVSFPEVVVVPEESGPKSPPLSPQPQPLVSPPPAPSELEMSVKSLGGKSISFKRENSVVSKKSSSFRNEEGGLQNKSSSIRKASIRRKSELLQQQQQQQPQQQDVKRHESRKNVMEFKAEDQLTPFNNVADNRKDDDDVPPMATFTPEDNMLPIGTSDVHENSRRMPEDNNPGIEEGDTLCASIEIDNSNAENTPPEDQIEQETSNDEVEVTPLLPVVSVSINLDNFPVVLSVSTIEPSESGGSFRNTGKKKSSISTSPRSSSPRGQSPRSLSSPRGTMKQTATAPNFQKRRQSSVTTLQPPPATATATTEESALSKSARTKSVQGVANLKRLAKSVISQKDANPPDPNQIAFDPSLVFPKASATDFLRLTRSPLTHPQEVFPIPNPNATYHALIVAIEKYADNRIPDVPQAIADGVAAAALLSRLGYNCTLMHTERSGRYKPTRDNILREWVDMHKKRKSRGVFLLLMIGRGIVGTLGNQIEDEMPMYILCPNSEYHNITPETVVTTKELMATANSVVIVDGYPIKDIEGVREDCEGFGFVGSNVMLPPMDFVVYGSAKQRGGILTHYALKGLEGAAYRDGKLTQNQFGVYLREKLRKWRYDESQIYSNATSFSVGGTDIVQKERHIQFRADTEDVRRSTTPCRFMLNGTAHVDVEKYGASYLKSIILARIHSLIDKSTAKIENTVKLRFTHVYLQQDYYLLYEPNAFGYNTANVSEKSLERKHNFGPNVPRKAVKFLPGKGCFALHNVPPGVNMTSAGGKDVADVRRGVHLYFWGSQRDFHKISKLCRANMFDMKKFCGIQIQSIEVIKGTEESHLAATKIQSAWKMVVLRRAWKMTFALILEYKELSVTLEQEWQLEISAVRLSSNSNLQVLFFKVEEDERRDRVQYEKEDWNTLIRRAMQNIEKLEHRVRQACMQEEAWLSCPVSEASSRFSIASWFEVGWYFLITSQRIQGAAIQRRVQIDREEYAARLTIRNEARLYIQVGR
eukprot:PhF_6_TR957/c0_g1_i1/m.1792